MFDRNCNAVSTWLNDIIRGKAIYSVSVSIQCKSLYNAVACQQHLLSIDTL